MIFGLETNMPVW